MCVCNILRLKLKCNNKVTYKKLFMFYGLLKLQRTHIQLKKVEIFTTVYNRNYL